MKYMLSFGSLRKTNGEKGYNFDRFGKGTQKYIKDVVLNGWEMRDLTYYPAICKGAGTIKCELQEVEDAAFSRIQSMEKGAGYSETELDVDGVKATIFFMDAKRLQHYPIVESGDWI